MDQYVQQISQMFASGRLSIANYTVKQLADNNVYEKLIDGLGKIVLKDIKQKINERTNDVAEIIFKMD